MQRWQGSWLRLRKATMELNDRQKEILAIEQDYDFVFSTDAGKRVLEDMEKSFFRRISHTPGDPYTTAFKEGQRDVVKKIHEVIQRAHIPDRFKVKQGEADNFIGPEFGSQ